MTGDGQHFDGALTPAGERALDALVDSGFDAEAVEPGMRDEARRVSRLLGVLDSADGWPSGRMSASGAGRGAGSLADGVMAAIRERRERESSLTARDDEALEALVMNGFVPSRAAGPLRERAARHSALASAVTMLGEEGERWIAAGRAVRTERVLDAVRSADSATIPFEHVGRRRGFRFTDLIAAAAVLLLGSAVVMPVLNSFTEEGRRVACLSNLQSAGLGLGLYAAANDDALPMATAGFGGSWSDVGQLGRSHSANLFTLVRTRHVKPWDLECPSNEYARSAGLDENDHDWGSVEEVSYSYRLMPRGRQRLDVLEPGAVVLGDRSPVLLAGLRGRRISPEANSPNHGGEGQHLVAVHGGVDWSGTPVLETGDNIWLPRVVEEFVQSVRKKYGYVDGYELPSTPDDTFLGP